MFWLDILYPAYHAGVDECYNGVKRYIVNLLHNGPFKETKTAAKPEHYTWKLFITSPVHL